MDWYKRLDNSIREYEDYKSVLQHSIDWICDHIDWCWRWKKITDDQKNDLCDRIILVMERR